MAGGSKRRFCEHCQLDVHNLSAMSQGERDRFVAESGGRACIAYELRADGSMVTPSLWRRVSAPFWRVQLAIVAVLTTVLPFFFTACATRRTLGYGVAAQAHAHQDGASLDQTSSVTVGVPLLPEKSPGK
jgi:hypothetical protein